MTNNQEFRTCVRILIFAVLIMGLTHLYHTNFVDWAKEEPARFETKFFVLFSFLVSLFSVVAYQFIEFFNRTILIRYVMISFFSSAFYVGFYPVLYEFFYRVHLGFRIMANPFLIFIWNVTVF